MKFAILIPLAALVLATNSYAQSRIWRCGNAYTNDEAQAKAQGCKTVEGGNVTVVQGTRVNGAAATNSNNAVRVANSQPTSSQRVDAKEQDKRDAEARTILESELKKAENRQADLLKEYNNGEPEKMGPEHKNHQKYLDRVADMKAGIERNARDIEGLKRELGRTTQ
jgi:hypothetical protein